MHVLYKLSECVKVLGFKQKFCSTSSALFKGRGLSDVSNYHTISIICSITNIFEKRIFNKLSLYIISLNILSPFQSGFRPNFSITTDLLK